MVSFKRHYSLDIFPPPQSTLTFRFIPYNASTTPQLLEEYLTSMYLYGRLRVNNVEQTGSSLSDGKWTQIDENTWEFYYTGNANEEITSYYFNIPSPGNYSIVADDNNTSTPFLLGDNITWIFKVQKTIYYFVDD